MTTPIAELRNVKVEYGGRVVLDVGYLALEPGSTLTVIGPNGSGKSTLLRVLAMLERPAQGQLFYRGQPVSNDGEALHYRRCLALVMQEPLLRNASTWENVATGLRFRRVSSRETRRRVDEWLEKFDISHLAGRNARSLSGGEAQRASLARALVLEPDILLLDEPFASLDEPTRLSLIEDIHRILYQARKTTIFVTHDRSEAQALGDRLAVMIDGRLGQMGRPQEVFATPSSEEVAAFVGVENILTGRVSRQAGGLATVLIGPAALSVVGDYVLGEELVMGIRPEAVTLESFSREAVLTSALNRLSGSVSRITPMGALARVWVDCGFPLMSLVTNQSVENLSLSSGTEVLASFKASAIHVIRRGRRDSLGHGEQAT